LLGVGGLILADTLTSKNEGQGYHSVAGDMMVLGGSILYAVSNVAEEFVVKKFDMVEFLSMIGVFGVVISGVQLAILEREELSNLDFESYETIILLVGFTLCLFIYYSLTPVMMRITSAAVVNLSILSADFYALVVGLFLFKYSFHPLYFVAFVFVIVGVVVFCSKKVTDARGRHIETEPEAGPTVQTPSCSVNCAPEEEEEGDEVPLNHASHSETTPLNPAPHDEATPLKVS
jgi:solute carrier family 35 protein F1/2